MIIGQGNSFIQPNSATPPPVFPPFPATSADNGLSVDAVTGRIVFGDDDYPPALAPGRFLNNRALFLEDFLFTIYNNWLAGNQMFFMDPLSDIFQFGDINGIASGNFLNQSTGLVQLGDVNNTSGNYLMSMDNATPLFTMSHNLNRFIFSANVAGTNILQLGDIDNFATRVFHRLDSSGEHWRVFHSNTIYVDWDWQTGLLDLGDITQNAMLRFDLTNNIASLGDANGLNNGTVFSVDDNNNVFNFGNTLATAGININGVAGFTGTVAPVNTITVDAGIVTNVA